MHRRTKNILTWMIIVLGVIALSLYFKYILDLVRTQDAKAEAQTKVTARQEAEMKESLRLSEEKRIEAKNKAWLRCKEEGDRPVMAGLSAVVCIKSEAVAWEYAVP